MIETVQAEIAAKTSLRHKCARAQVIRQAMLKVELVTVEERELQRIQEHPVF